MAPYDIPMEENITGSNEILRTQEKRSVISGGLAMARKELGSSAGLEMIKRGQIGMIRSAVNAPTPLLASGTSAAQASHTIWSRKSEQTRWSVAGCCRNGGTDSAGETAELWFRACRRASAVPLSANMNETLTCQ